MLDLNQFKWAEFSYTENRNLYVADSLSGVRKKRSQGQHRFEFELVSILMDSQTGRAMAAKLNGAALDVMSFIHPRYGYSRGTIPSNGLVLSRAAAAGATVVYVKSPTNQSWQLKAGDFIQFGADTKVYQVMDDTTLSTTEQTVSLTFPLRFAAGANMQAKANGVTWLLSSDGAVEVSTNANDDQSIELTLVAVEKLA